MKSYDLIAIGTGSAMNIVEAMLQSDPDKKAAVIDGMHIHPALSEVVERAFFSLMPPYQYEHMLKEGWI